MNEQRAELVSALLDGELEGEQREQALEAVLDDPTLRQRWHAYHLIGDVLRARNKETPATLRRVFEAP